MTSNITLKIAPCGRLDAPQAARHLVQRWASSVTSVVAISRILLAVTIAFVTVTNVAIAHEPLGKDSVDQCAIPPWQGSAYIEQLRTSAPSLSAACQRIFLDPAAPIFPSIEAECKATGGPDENWCMATKLATFYLKREQIHEFAVLYDNLSIECPAPQLREYFKARLYYLATQLDSKDIARSAYRDFDFGPVDTTILGAIRSNGSTDTLGKEYDLAMDKHRPPKHFALTQIQARCQAAQPIIPPDLPHKAAAGR